MVGPVKELAAAPGLAAAARSEKSTLATTNGPDPKPKPSSSTVDTGTSKLGLLRKIHRWTKKGALKTQTAHVSWKA